MIKSLAATLIALAISLPLTAASVSAPTAVHTKPDANAPVITVLDPGTEIDSEPSATGSLPMGWQSISQPGPFEGYVLNKDLDKALHVKPGTEIHLQPSPSSGVLATMTEGDKTSITGLHGKWTQIKLESPVVGYIQEAGVSAAASKVTLAPVAAPAASSSNTSPASPSPSYQQIKSNAVTSTSQNFRDSGAAMPRVFEGRFVSTYRPFTPRRPYDWQLNDEAGVRYAYLDISKLLLTDQIENYVNYTVIVSGKPQASADGKNLVIQIETLRLK